MRNKSQNHLGRIAFIAAIIISNFISIQSQAQDSAAAKYNVDRTSFGIGLGIDYGGIGGNFLIYPQKNIGIFAGGGYAFIGIGYNVGLKLRLVSDKKPTVVPYLLAMYGYNTAIKVSDESGFSLGINNYNKFFYGPSFGVGLDLYSARNNSGYWTFDVIIPVRTADVNNYINYLETTDDITFKNKPLPVLISIAYRIK